MPGSLLEMSLSAGSAVARQARAAVATAAEIFMAGRNVKRVDREKDLRSLKKLSEICARKGKAETRTD